MNPIMGILRHAFRKEFNILTAATHERFQSNFSDLYLNFEIKFKSITFCILSLPIL
jgi:hypothetical protein